MHTTAPFKERLIRYRMETDDRSLEPADDAHLFRSIARVRLLVFAGFGMIGLAALSLLFLVGGR